MNNQRARWARVRAGLALRRGTRAGQHRPGAPADQLEDDRLEGPAGVFARLLFSGPSLGLLLQRGVAPGSPAPDAGVYLGDARQRVTIAAIFTSDLTELVEFYTPVARALATMEVPMIVGWGGRDPFFPVEQGVRTAAAARNGRLHVFEGAGHFLPHERPAEVAQVVTELAAAVRPSGIPGSP